MKARRYQLRKHAVAVVERDHPWIFRDQLSSAAEIFADGDWLRLVDGTNRVVGHGIFEAEGAIAIRVLRRGPDSPDAAYFRARIEAALVRRAPLVSRTDGIRLLHGESDGLPAVVVDRFADTLVVSSYTAGADALARFTAGTLYTLGHRARTDSPEDIGAVVGPATNVILRPAHRRLGPAPTPRVLRGEAPEIVHFLEDGRRLAVDLAAGQKTGTYLDLRGLRNAIATGFAPSTSERAMGSNPISGHVLNLFAYSGMLGQAAELAGAAHVTQVDVSERALAFAAANHVGDPAKHTFVAADVFEWLPALDAGASFALVIVDPPSMTSNVTQVPKVLAAYRRLYRAAATHVLPDGLLIAACCTSRVQRTAFRDCVREALGASFTLERELACEVDHPVGFPQADYLKILCWRRAAT